jgi:hypothetical protein
MGGGQARRACEPEGKLSGAKICLCAVVAQLVERELPKLEVAGSRPVRRFQRAAPNTALQLL